jgi:hypothetical protein
LKLETRNYSVTGNTQLATGNNQYHFIGLKRSDPRVRLGPTVLESRLSVTVLKRSELFSL